MTSVTPRRLVVCASHSPGKERDVEQVFGRKFRSALAKAAVGLFVERCSPCCASRFAGTVTPGACASNWTT